MQQHGHQQRRQHRAQQVGRGGRADGAGHVAARHGREGDGRLHRGRQRADEQHAQPQAGRQQTGKQRPQSQAQQREQHEGAAQDQGMQAQVLHSRHNGVGGQPRPVQEEQQRDRHVAGDQHERRPLPTAGNTLARITVAISVRVKASGRKRRMAEVPGQFPTTIGAPLAIVKPIDYFDCHRNFLLPAAMLNPLWLKTFAAAAAAQLHRGRAAAGLTQPPSANTCASWSRR